MADRAGWQEVVESELRAVGRELAVPPAGDLTAPVRRRLAGQADGPPGRGAGARRRLGWRAALVMVVALLTVVIATPQGRAVIIGVFRFAGVELRQGPVPARAPATSAALPGQRRMPLGQARHRVSFPLLVPAALGRPGRVVVGDGGRVVSLLYRQTPYGLVRIDEFAGRLDQVYFQKTVDFRTVAHVRVNGAKGLWIRGPHALGYITAAGTPAVASARLTTGNTLIWGTGQVALRLEGNLSKTVALAIARSAH